MIKDCFIILFLSLDIDEKLDKRDLHMVKISDDGAKEEFGLDDLPCLVYFENGVPQVFTGRFYLALCVLKTIRI